jgi:hypothetical protein
MKEPNVREYPDMRVFMTDCKLLPMVTSKVHR